MSKKTPEITTYAQPLTCDTCNVPTDALEVIAVKILAYDGFKIKPEFMFVCPCCYAEASKRVKGGK